MGPRIVRPSADLQLTGKLVTVKTETVQCAPAPQGKIAELSSGNGAARRGYSRCPDVSRGFRPRCKWAARTGRDHGPRGGRKAVRLLVQRQPQWIAGGTRSSAPS